MFTTSFLGQSLSRGTLSGFSPISEARRLICRKTETRVRSKKKWRIIRHSLQSRTPTSPIGGSWLGDIPPNTPLRGERLCFPGSGEGAKQRWLRHLLHGTPRGPLASPSDSRCPGPRIYFIEKVADAEAPDQVGCLISFRFEVRMRPGSNSDADGNITEIMLDGRRREALRCSHPLSV